MEITEDLYQTLHSLEQALWIAATRFDQAFMNDVLDEEFFEFGRSGRVYDRKTCIEATPSQIKAKLPLENFVVHSLDENSVLVTYVSRAEYEEEEVANRSSIWRHDGQKWKLRFHQGTPRP